MKSKYKCKILQQQTKYLWWLQLIINWKLNDFLLNNFTFAEKDLLFDKHNKLISIHSKTLARKYTTFIYFSQFSNPFIHCIHILFATNSIKVNYMKVINVKEKYEAAVHVTQHLIDSVKVGLSARAKQHPLSNLYYQSSAIVIVIRRGFLTNHVVIQLN